jgi:hypothetical protein
MATDQHREQTPAPDHKNWAWVLDRPCPECGFEAAAYTGERRDEIAGAMRANAAAFRSALKRGDIVGRRPPVPAGQPPVWSALEYGAHVRDVYALTAERLTRMIKKKAPTFKDWDQNQAAIDGDYATEDPDRVAYDLAVNAGKVADILDRVRGDDWDRTGTRSDGQSFTIVSFAAYMLHDVSHHLWDVEQGFAAITEADKKARTSTPADED